MVAGPGPSTTGGKQGYCQGGVPGQMGIVKSQVLIWDHDPFYARPMQNVSFPMSDSVGDQIQETDKAGGSEVEFLMDTVFLKPVYKPEHMFLATMKKNNDEFEFDYLKHGSQEVKPGLLPGLDRNVNEDGEEVVQEIAAKRFVHLLWIHTGSLFRSSPLLHPSEYPVNIQLTAGGVAAAAQVDEETKKEKYHELAAAPRWQYTVPTEDEKQVYRPYMVSKQARQSKEPVHWCLEKYSRVWQGCDFFVKIQRGDKRLDEGVDRLPGGEDTEPIGSEDLLYQYLMYKKPSIGPTPKNWVDGISNSAFTINDEDTGKAPGNSSSTPHIPPDREKYWWDHKSYILIEIGHNDPYHNYIIEICKGRSPRLLHIGYQWDHPDRLVLDEIPVNDPGWKYMLKCRSISEYKQVRSESLLSQEDLQVSVRNHLGKLVVTFSGHEGNPWIISRRDLGETGEIETIKMYVPAGKIRILGGNISCKVGFGFTQYPQHASMPFNEVQPDTKDMDDEDLYITLSNMGSVSDAKGQNVRDKIFATTAEQRNRIGEVTLSYDCEAQHVREYVRNHSQQINLYQQFQQQYQEIGKGWDYILPDANVLETIDPEAQPQIAKKPVVHPDFPHRIEMRKGEKSTSKLEKGEGVDSNDQSEYMSSWTFTSHLFSGHVVMSDNTFPDAEYAETFENVLTPIMTQWRMFVTGGSKITENIEPFDISPLVMQMSDSWSAEDFTTLSHEMTIKCYLPLGASTGLPIEAGIENTSDLQSLASRLYDLHNQAFYVTVKYWWGDPGVGENTAPSNKYSGLSRPEEDDTLIQMTGIAFGGQMEFQANKMYMTIKVQDYMEVLRKSFIFNSPFFDGTNDTLAMYEIAKLAGFDDRSQDEVPPRVIDRRPLGYLEKVLKAQASLNAPPNHRYTWNGEYSITRPYDLPASYADIANPAVKFANGESYESCIKKIASYAGKTVYFDRWGTMRYESPPAYEAAFASNEHVWSIYKPVFNFVSTPYANRPPSASDGGGSYLPDGYVFSPPDVSHLVYNSIKYYRSVEDCINHIVLFTASKHMETSDGRDVAGYAILGHSFYKQLWDPTAEGFLGFRKVFYQSNGVFGGLKELKRTINHYAKMSIPPATCSFETFGVPGLKALDIITLDGDYFYITDISHEIVPKENRWWMTIEGEWLKPFRDDLGFFNNSEEENGGTE